MRRVIWKFQALDYLSCKLIKFWVKLVVCWIGTAINKKKENVIFKLSSQLHLSWHWLRIKKEYQLLNQKKNPSNNQICKSDNKNKENQYNESYLCPNGSLGLDPSLTSESHLS